MEKLTGAHWGRLRGRLIGRGKGKEPRIKQIFMSLHNMQRVIKYNKYNVVRISKLTVKMLQGPASKYAWPWHTAWHHDAEAAAVLGGMRKTRAERQRVATFVTYA